MTRKPSTSPESELGKTLCVTETIAPVLTAIVARDGERFGAHCPELDLLTEMDTAEAALADLLSMMREYAEDYRANEDRFRRSPNRGHHYPFVEEILRCADPWELREKVTVRFGHVHLSPVPQGAGRRWIPAPP